MAATVKRCTKCGDEKPLDCYSPNKFGKFGKASRCKPCQVKLSQQWNEQNPDRVREIDRERYARHRDKRKAVMQEIRDRDRPAHRAKMREWSKAKYRRDPQKQRAAVAAWAGKNPDKAKACRDHSNLMRRARVHKASGTHTKAQRLYLHASYLGRCAYCFSVAATDFDHVVPLARGGSNDIGNLVPACEKCNASKGAKSLLEFMMYRKAA
jgi:5-methylcytosine-specific restriction endonuclease McrA